MRLSTCWPSSLRCLLPRTPKHPRSRGKPCRRYPPWPWRAATLTPRVSPPSYRENSAVSGVASVANIDWPSKPGLSTAEQKAELLVILDRTQAQRLNAVILQIRPSRRCAVQEQHRALVGVPHRTAGTGASPTWDHWRLRSQRHTGAASKLHTCSIPTGRAIPAPRAAVEAHLANTRPALVKKYGTHQWMGSGRERRAQAHAARGA